LHIEEQITISKKEYERLLSLEVLVLQLQEEIRLLKNGKKSNTSHTSPSHDIGRGNSKSLRAKSDNKPGGQKGHDGHTLQMSSAPDETIDHKPHFCGACASPLTSLAQELTDRKQEIVIPPIQARCIEHRSYSITCACGHINVSHLPFHLKAPIQYGTSVSATVTYLFAYQYLPYNRIKKAMRDLFGISLSEGTIDNILAKMSALAMPLYKHIQGRVQESSVVGGDETGTKINGHKGWFHVWQNPWLTFIVAAATRGYKTTELYFERGFEKAVYVSDCWSAQLKTPAKKHQLCLAHLLRELTNFEDALRCTWSTQLKRLLKKAIALKKELQDHDYLHPPLSVTALELELKKMLEVDVGRFHPKSKAFVKRLIKNKESVFTFLYYRNVPYDNNGSERAIRNVKVKNKVSGSFRSEQGATRFAILRSVVDTTVKNGQDVFNALNLLASTAPE
jgi:transposase